ncbi:MAG: hypothetical protein KBG00_09265 [Rhodoferax sp.]|uniref:hypothetical protein n=1 Tax=Rhodoferax sp. TaxID=50421 RepID=UPI001B6EF41F|nr:hypothetical protein [Rhodoferax sp.]MBP9148955.1 hypothetical protein [Rhodoferax sp.]MBP9735877.1 hypothetical protein [Rhodoferax sp.]
MRFTSSRPAIGYGISPTRGQPFWDDGDVPVGERTQIEPIDGDLLAQPAPDFEVDQRTSW